MRRRRRSRRSKGGGWKGIEGARFESGLFLFCFFLFFASLIFGVCFDFDRPASSCSCARRRILPVMMFMTLIYSCKQSFVLCARQSARKSEVCK